MDQIGPYQIQGELGRGAMGVVFRGIDPVIGRTVAVKTLHTKDLGDSSEQEKLKERLFREAKSAGILSHPNIVTIYQAGQDNDVLFIAMEFIDGPNLADVLLKTRPRVELTLELLKQAAEALDYAHSKGVVHRDIKPANLMLQREGRIKIADFGIAKLASTNLTKTGTSVGSPAYMSPEQIRAAPVDGRADQYSLAIMAYEMITGVRPYDSETITSLVFKIVFEQPDLSALGQVEGGSRLEPVFRKALSKAADDRYPNCVAFWYALAAAWQAGGSSKLDETWGNPSAMPMPSPAPAPQSAPLVAAPMVATPVTGRRPGLSSGMLMGIAAGAAVMIGGGGFWMWSSRNAVAPTQPVLHGEKAKAPLEKAAQDQGSPEKATQPIPLQQVAAEYTPEALKAGIEGSVLVKVGINEQGDVEEAEVVRPLEPGLDKKALEAAKKWKWKPAMVKGKPVAVQQQVELEFLIKKQQ